MYKVVALLETYDFWQDGGAGVLEAVSTLLGPIGFFTIILLCVGVCIVYHNAK